MHGIKTLPLRALQFTAILGDLQHKSDLYVRYQDYSVRVSCRFANCEQAGYITDTHPEMIPPGHWSIHSLGTFFEYYYYSNLTFRFEYMSAPPECGSHMCLKR